MFPNRLSVIGSEGSSRGTRGCGERGGGWCFLSPSKQRAWPPRVQTCIPPFEHNICLCQSLGPSEDRNDHPGALDMRPSSNLATLLIVKATAWQRSKCADIEGLSQVGRMRRQKDDIYGVAHAVLEELGSYMTSVSTEMRNRPWEGSQGAVDGWDRVVSHWYPRKSFVPLRARIPLSALGEHL